jgi:hypothetical protein
MKVAAKKQAVCVCIGVKCLDQSAISVEKRQYSTLSELPSVYGVEMPKSPFT